MPLFDSGPSVLHFILVGRASPALGFLKRIRFLLQTILLHNSYLCNKGVWSAQVFHIKFPCYIQNFSSRVDVNAILRNLPRVCNCVTRPHWWKWLLYFRYITFTQATLYSTRNEIWSDCVSYAKTVNLKKCHLILRSYEIDNTGQ